MAKWYRAVWDGPIDEVLGRLSGVRKSGQKWQAICPAHRDKKPSLSVGVGDDGRVLLHCHAGCSAESIVGAIGLRTRDLFPERRRDSFQNRVRQAYDYTDERGKLLYQSVRMEPKDFRLRRPDGKGGWIWSLSGVKRVLYNLPAVLLEAANGGTVFIAEGEKDCDSLTRLGLTATTNSEGAGQPWLSSYTTALIGSRVVILPDNDAPGRKHAEKVAASIGGVCKVRIVELPGLAHKGDVTDWLRSGHTKDELLALVESMPDRETPVVETPIEPPDERTFPLTDLGNAERLIAAHGNDLRYNVESDKWLVWNGRMWEVDRTGRVSRLAREVVRSMHDQLKDCETVAEREALFGHIRRSESAQRLGAMVSLARECAGIPVQVSDLDAGKWLLNCANGTIDLRTGILRPHRREDLITRIVDLQFDPTAACPTWERFLSDIFPQEPELIEFVRRSMGYSLTGDTREQCFLMLHGNGSNGKSTLLTVLREMLSDYHRKTGTDTLLEQRDNGSTNDIARLKGARVVSAIETKPGRRLAEALVKELTGGDAITARFLYQEYFDFVPEFKLWLACNHLPNIDGQDNAIWRRICLVPFRVQFEDPDAPRGPYKDKRLPDKLRAEYPGILAWMVRGCLDWQREGLKRPPAVQGATTKYQDDMDVLADFLSECCVIRPDVKVQSSALYAEYQNWARSHGEKFPLSGRVFNMRIEERGRFEKRRMARGYTWLGISIAADAHGLSPADQPPAKAASNVPSVLTQPISKNPPVNSLVRRFLQTGTSSTQSTSSRPHCTHCASYRVHPDPLAFNGEGSMHCRDCHLETPY